MIFHRNSFSQTDSADTQTSIENLKHVLDRADAVVIGAGAGLSASAGFHYGGERFQKYFQDFEEKYHFHDMYSGMFVQYYSPEEIWAFWSRSIWLNRYMDPPKPVYQLLLELIREKDYFVITTNIDHCFQKAGFNKERLFYTQGEYGLWQCSVPCHNRTYDNKEPVMELLRVQGYEINQEDNLIIPQNTVPKMRIPTELIPKCPECGMPMNMNLRNDDTFVEDEGWHRAKSRYQDFLKQHQEDSVLFLELGVGWNTPIIIKYPFWRMAASWPHSVYACINRGQALAPENIENRSICINDDIMTSLLQLK